MAGIYLEVSEVRDSEGLRGRLESSVGIGYSSR